MKKHILKYRLIQTYPGSLELGSIITIDSTQETGFYSQNPKFWEEVIEKEYEISQILYATEIRTLYEGQYRTFFDGVGFDLDYLLENGGKIHSVKRLSDGEVFTIGDNTNNGIISEIHIALSFNGGVLFKIKDKTIAISINGAKKVELPVLFTTEDGVEIRANGNKVWWLDREYRLYDTYFGPKDICYKEDKYFSTREAAVAYRLRYKPCLSLDDIQRAIKLPPMFWEALLAAAKLKLKYGQDKTNQKVN